MSINFDRAADFYDATRAMPEPMAEAVFGLIIEKGQLKPGTRVLELGVGTGRIAAPLVEKMALNYFGIDISAKMLARLAEKTDDKSYPIHIIRADTTSLPFHDESFDVLMAIHLFHLVPRWKKALVAAAAALKPGGKLLVAGEYGLRMGIMETFTKTAPEKFASKAGNILERLGIREGWAGMDDVGEAAKELQKMGANVEQPPFIKHELEIPLGGVIGLIKGRVFSSLWDIAQPELDSCVEDLQALIMDQFGSLKTNITITRRFELVCATF